MNRVVEGSAIVLKVFFLDEDEEPLFPAEGSTGPQLLVKDKEGYIITQAMASVGDDTEPGSWIASVSIPDLGLTEETELSLMWTYDSEEGRERNRDRLIVEPSNLIEPKDIMVYMRSGLPAKGHVAIPIPYMEGDDIAIVLAEGNDILFALDANDENSNIEIGKFANRMEFSFPAVGELKRLKPLSLTVEVTRAGAYMPQLFNYLLWYVNPSIMTASSLLEQQINKAKLENVIAELDYSAVDLIHYLYRGLQLFNNLPSQPTDFWGTDMRGILLEHWITCSSYYALSAQLQAEGQMAFDFSGQTVSFNVDRSPSIEAALGRVETMINEHVKPFKKMAIRSGVTSGTGAQGERKMSFGQSFGITKISPSAMVKRSNSNMPITHRHLF